VARAHIIAEEATRALAIISRVTGLECPALGQSEEKLADRIFHHERSTVVQDGIYCRGRCSVAFWRCLAAGGYGPQRQTIRQGLTSLARHRDGHGGWRRFPFYDTLTLLGEIDSRLAAEEGTYCSSRFADRRRLLARKTDRFSCRRLQVINRLTVDVPPEISHRIFRSSAIAVNCSKAVSKSAVISAFAIHLAFVGLAVGFSPRSGISLTAAVPSG